MWWDKNSYFLNKKQIFCGLLWHQHFFESVRSFFKTLESYHQLRLALDQLFKNRLEFLFLLINHLLVLFKQLSLGLCQIQPVVYPLVHSIKPDYHKKDSYTGLSFCSLSIVYFVGLRALNLITLGLLLTHETDEPSTGTACSSLYIYWSSSFDPSDFYVC